MIFYIIVLAFYLAERKGFEPLRGLHLLAVFETAPFNHLGTSPKPISIITQQEKKPIGKILIEI